GNGDGTFQPAVPYTVGSSPAIVAVGDFNGDGRLDIVASNVGSTASPGSTVSVLLGNGNGTFQPALTSAAGPGPLGIAIGDFNHDGRLDIAVSNVRSLELSVLLGNGNGTFQAPVSYNIGKSPHEIIAAD